MTKVDIVFAIILLVAAVFLTIAVLMQFGKTKGKTIDRVLSKLTTVVAIVFALLVIVVYVIQDDNVVTKDNYIDDYINSIDETAAETTAAEDIAETTVAETSSVDAADTTAAE